MAHRALRAAVLTLLPSLALAQVSTVTLTTSEVNRADCAGTGSTAVTWRYVATTLGTDKYRLVAGGGSCPTSVPGENGTGTLGGDVLASSNPQSLSVPIATIQTAVSASCTNVNDTIATICVYFLLDGTATPVLVGSADFTFQTAIPPAPTASAGPANAAIEVSFSAGTKDASSQGDTLQYEVETKPAGGTYTSAGRSSTSPVRITGLTNGVAYTARVWAWSAASPLVGNRSLLPSAETTATPDDFLDFWSAYKNDGGREEGGCAAGGAGALAPLLLSVAVFLRRRA